MWREKSSQCCIVPQTPHSTATIFSRGIDLCHLKIPCNSRGSPASTWRLATLALSVPIQSTERREMHTFPFQSEIKSSRGSSYCRRCKLYIAQTLVKPGPINPRWDQSERGRLPINRNRKRDQQCMQTSKEGQLLSAASWPFPRCAESKFCSLPGFHEHARSSLFDKSLA